MATDLKTLTIAKVHEAFQNGDFSASELTSHYLEEIKSKNNDINAYLEVFDDALEQADTVDADLERGEKKPLSGIPVALKDNILFEGKRATAGSNILEGYIASYSATVTKKLREAGAIILGRTNLDEFAMGSSTEHSAFGVTKNPYDLNRVAGGSSGGSAAAVAMNGALIGIGSDTGGSIRQPASFCGAVGLKPTYGRVSRFGLIALGSSLDQIGPIGKSVADVEAVYNVIAGHDSMDSTSLSDDAFRESRGGSKTIGVPFDFLKEGVEKDVLENFNQSLELLKSKGHKVKDISLSFIKYSLAAYYIILPAEASANLARFDGVRYGLYKEGGDVHDDYFETRGKGFGREPRRRILLGTYVLSSGYYDAYYNKAQYVRTLIQNDFQSAFKDVDVIAMPTTPTPAFKIGEKKDPLSMYMADLFTIPANITGMPAISVPSGIVDREGVSLPVGLQITAPHLCESLLFQIGKEFLGE